MFWIANNACDILNSKNYLYLSDGSYQGSITLMLFAGNCLRATHSCTSSAAHVFYYSTVNGHLAANIAGTMNRIQLKSELQLRLSAKFYLMPKKEIQIWPEVLVKKVTKQCTKMKTQTEACYPCKITKTNHFTQF